MRVGGSVIHCPTLVSRRNRPLVKLSLIVFAVVIVILFFTTSPDTSQHHYADKHYKMYQSFDLMEENNQDYDAVVRQERYERLLRHEADRLNARDAPNQHLKKKKKHSREDARIVAPPADMGDQPDVFGQDDGAGENVDDFMLQQLNPGGADVIMAMDAVKHQLNEINDMQRKILAQQDRLSDRQYNVNITASDQISMDRSIVDTRFDACRSRRYDPQTQTKTSVVIPFYNEPLSMLMRTVHSILNRTPDRLLAEVILVDDRSTLDYLKEPLDMYMGMLPKVKILRNQNREGLIRSRLAGFDISSGDVVVFLDAHTECNEGWLEPLLDELHRHPQSVVQPTVDGIDAWTIEYHAPPSMYKGAFSWDLRYTWLRIPNHQQAHIWEYAYPHAAPTLVGCAIAVGKQYFKEIGLFDEGLNVWGGENIELAWRVWMCGGSVVTVPCSRVGHVFKNFPYKFEGDKETVVEKNLMRLAETWMDDYKKYFYASTRVYEFKRANFTEEEISSVAERKELRKSLKCQSFEWYMYNLLPEIEAPPMDALYYGEIMQVKTRGCWEVLPSGYIGMTFTCFEHKMIPKNYFRLTHDGLLKYKDRCVSFSPPSPMLLLSECPGRDAEKLQKERFGTWRLNNRGHYWGILEVTKVWQKSQMVDGEVKSQEVRTMFCIGQVTNTLEEHNKEQMPQLGKCADGNEYQMWGWTYKFDYSLYYT